MALTKLYRLSITVGTEQGTNIITDEVEGESIYFAEFDDINECNDYLDNCFTIIEHGTNYNTYIKNRKEIL